MITPTHWPLFSPSTSLGKVDLESIAPPAETASREVPIAVPLFLFSLPVLAELHSYLTTDAAEALRMETGLHSGHEINASKIVFPLSKYELLI